MQRTAILLFAILVIAAGCSNNKKSTEKSAKTTDTTVTESKFLNEPLMEHIFTADPSAHVFEGKIYIYPSHDIDAGIPDNDLGDQYAMRDYHVFSMEEPNGEVTDHGEVLSVDDIPWAGRQLWAPDAAHANGKYYLYFPMKDKNDVFRIGVAISDNPEGPFTPEPEPIAGSFSMDPAVFQDDDGAFYMYFGGIWGGQLQKWKDGEYDPEGTEPAADEPALSPQIARLDDDMVSFAEPPEYVLILDEDGYSLKAGDNDRRFFEAAWVHKYNGTYYFSYSTGDTHKIVYATGDNPYGPFTYQGVILKPVQGWTNHHSIVEFEGKWYLFYHDTQLSGKNHLRNIKMTELTHNADGTIQTIDPMKK